MVDSADSYPVDISNCTPDVPDIQGEIDKGIATAKGKIADLDFRPVDFSMDLSKYFSFNMIGKILGKPSGLGYDMCAVCIDGDIDAAIAGSPFPDGGQSTIDGINGSIDGINSSLSQQQQQINQNSQNINNIENPDEPGTYWTLDSAIANLYQQIDSVSDVVDSAGI
jgi:hypothetical protein